MRLNCLCIYTSEEKKKEEREKVRDARESPKAHNARLKFNNEIPETQGELPFLTLKICPLYKFVF